jgi:hypothetical protein
MQKNCLDRISQRKLEDLVLEHRAEVEAGKWTIVAMADALGKRMGRPLTSANVKGAMRAVSIDLPKNKVTIGKSIREMRAELLEERETQ